MGGYATIWTGAAVHCPLAGNYIVLYHHYSKSTSRSCNNRTIVGQILSVEDNNYTSQLNVTVTPDTAGKTITCSKDTGYMDEIQFSLEIPVIAGLYHNLHCQSANGNVY